MKVSTFTNAAFEVWRASTEGTAKFGVYTQSAGQTGYYGCCARLYRKNLLYNRVYASATYTAATISVP